MNHSNYDLNRDEGMYRQRTNGVMQLPYVGGTAVVSPNPDDRMVAYTHVIDEHFNMGPTLGASNAELNETADPGFATFDTKQFTDAVNGAVDPITRMMTPARFKAITLQAAIENLNALNCINKNLIKLDKDVVEGNHRVEEAVRASARSMSNGHGNTTHENMATLNALLNSSPSGSSSTPSRYFAA